MVERNEVSSYRLHVKEPGTDRLRKGAAGQLRHLEATGWRETARRVTHDCVTVRMERSKTVVAGFVPGDGQRRGHR